MEFHYNSPSLTSKENLTQHFLVKITKIVTSSVTFSAALFVKLIYLGIPDIENIIITIDCNPQI